MQEPYLFIYFYDLRPFSPIYNGMRDVTPKLLKQNLMLFGFLIYNSIKFVEIIFNASSVQFIKQKILTDNAIFNLDYCTKRHQS